MKNLSFFLLLFFTFSFPLVYCAPIDTYYITSKTDASNTLSSAFNVKTVIIDEENLSRSDSVKEALEKVPGVTIFSMGGPMESSLVRLRGSTVEQVVILVDGRRINSIQSGKYDISSIPLYNVEKIEVIEGALSSLYGENAIGGVINIVTKRNSKEGTFITSDLSYGSYNTIRGSVFLQSKKILSSLLIHPFTQSPIDYPLSSFSYSLGAFAHYSDGEYPYVHQLTNNDLTRINADGIKVGLTSTFTFDINRAKEIALTGEFSLYLDEKGVPGAIEFPSYYATLSDKKMSTSITYQYKNNPFFAIVVDSTLSYTHRLWDPNSTSSNQNRFSVHENSTTSLAIRLNRDDEVGLISSSFAIRSSFRYDTLNSSDLETSNNSGVRVRGSFYRTHLDAAIHDTFSYKNISIVPSFRVDTHTIGNNANSDTSSSTHLSSNIGSSFSFYENLIIRLNFGSAYRVPTFDDMFWSSSAFAVGNPYLKSEHASSFDVGIDYEVNRFISLRALYFAISLDDLIQWVPGADGKWSPHNIGNVEKRGVEGTVQVDVLLRNILSSLALTYQCIDAVDVTPNLATYNKRLPFIAPHVVKGILSVGNKDTWNAEVDLTYTSYRYITASNTKIVPHNLLLNASFFYSITPQWSVSAHINNILNREYYDAQFYPIPGIHGKVSIAYKGEKR